MADLYSVLPGLQPTAQEIVQAELLAQQIVQAQFPDIDLRLGTGVRDLVIRPNAFLLALVNKGLKYYFAQNTLRGVNNSTPQEVVDNILSNWFLSRKLGTFAVINARLYFARQKNVSIASNTFFSPDNSLLYYPVQSFTIPSSAMSYDASQNEWYVDIDLQAGQQGTQYNISSGSLLYFSNFDPYFLHAEINYLASSSIAGETNENFISRAQTAISTRNLINNPSIVSNLQERFNFLDKVVPIGMGDPEMIRDQVKVIFDPEAPRLLGYLESTGLTARATLFNHGWNSGQIVTLTGASPSVYNGTFEITVVDGATFEYTLPSVAGTVTNLPEAQSVTAPLLIHNGGMVDVYCDKTLATSITQLTTDAAGVAILPGAVYSFKRSPITGGVQEDTIPLQKEVDYSMVTIDALDKTINVSAQSHGLANGSSVTLEGIEQKLNISDIVCSGLVVTVTSPNHGLLTGDTVIVTGVSPATYTGQYTVTKIDNNTLSYIVAANIPEPGLGSSMVMMNPLVVGEFTITVLGPDSFDINVPKLWTNGINSGTAVVSYDVPYVVSNPYLRSQPVSAMVCNGTTVTVTLANHGLVQGRYITIEGANQVGYNGNWLISSVLNGNQFTFEVPQTLTSPATGTLGCVSVVPWYDYGFSPLQQLRVDFGPNFSNRTASFEVSYFANVDSVQNYLETPANRVLLGNLLARGFNFYVLDINVVGYNGFIPNSGVVQDVAERFLESLEPGQPFIMSDFVSALEQEGIVSIQTPPGVEFTKYTRDLTPSETGTIPDYLDPEDRTSVFLLGNVTTEMSDI